MTPASSTPEIFCLGEPLVELNQQSDGRYLPGFGGDTSNCAIAAARQGARVGLLTRIGADAFGEQLQALWQQEGLDTRQVIQDPDAPTGVYFVTHHASGHQFSYLRAGSAASRMTPASFPPEALTGAQTLHTSGISQAISSSACDTVFALMAEARSLGVKVSFDTNLRLKLWSLNRARALIHEAVRQCDLVLPGLEDAIQLTGLEQPEAILDFYLNLGASVVALTLGAEGVWVATATERQRIPGFTVAAVDATGAGDTFDGAFLAEWVAGRSPFEAAVYANAAAALSTQGYGAVNPMPVRAQVEAYLQSC